MTAVGELLVSLVLIVCFWPTLFPSYWRDADRQEPETKWITVVQLGLAVAGILGTCNALARLT